MMQARSSPELDFDDPSSDEPLRKRVKKSQDAAPPKRPVDPKPTGPGHSASVIKVDSWERKPIFLPEDAAKEDRKPCAPLLFP